MSHDFNGKVTIVTGGGSGIGEACALTLAQGGAAVVVADFDVENGRRVTEAITVGGGRAIYHQVDVADPAQAEAMVGTAVSTFGGLHIAVNNAGIGGGATEPTGNYPLDVWRKVIGVNLDGVFYCMRYEIPAMISSGGGSIVNMASILGSVGFATAPAYVSAKHGVLGLTKTAALEYAGQGIRVNSVGPGFIRTPLLEASLDEATLGAIAQMHPVKRLGSAHEVANLVAFLCSEDSSFVTGAYYLVDGGYTAQ